MLEADRAVIEELFFLTTEYWIVDRITVRDNVTHSSIQLLSLIGNLKLPSDEYKRRRQERVNKCDVLTSYSIVQRVLYCS